MTSDKTIAIVDAFSDTEEADDQPFGKRWGGDFFTLTAEHIEALRNGKLIALDIMSEYVAFVRLDEQLQGDEALCGLTLSEDVLAEEWLSEEDNAAWAHL
jgi:hypothetical protein